MSNDDNAHRFEFTSIDGEKLPLDAWRGRPILVVNTASFCGYTPQYRELEDCGSAIATAASSCSGSRPTISASRSPDRRQKSGSSAKATTGSIFRSRRRCRVIGGAAHPFYRWIADSLGEAGTPRWNFHKY